MKSILDYLADNARTQPASVAFEILDTPRIKITYQQLKTKVEQHANGLQSKYHSGERVLLLYPSHLDFLISFLACLKANLIPVPIHPPNPHPERFLKQLNNVEAIIRNAKPSLILTTQKIKQYIRAIKIKTKLRNMWPYREKSTLDANQFFQLPTKCIQQFHKKHQPTSSESPSEIAFLQYTSGSTGDPKGVRITHENIINNTAKIAKVHDGIENIVTWLPLYHDMGLMNALFLPLYCGLPARILPPQHFIKNPLTWLQAISEHPQCTSGGPNFAFDYCIKKITKSEKEYLDLKHWKLAYIGAEPNRYETVTSFSTAFKQCGFNTNHFSPCYGLAESTVGVSGRHVKHHQATLTMLNVNKNTLEQGKINLVEHGEENSQVILSAGTWPEEDTVIIVDPETGMTLPADHVGEIWCQNKSIGDGYWMNPSATEHYFNAYTKTHQGPFLRTGDLGFIHHDELFITGRIKDLIIIRGRNFSAPDIEWACKNCHPQVRNGSVCAFSYSINFEERLCILCEIKPVPSPPAEIFKSIRQAINIQYDIKAGDIALLPEHSLEKTSSGKKRRSHCKHAYLEEKLPILAKQSSVNDIEICVNNKTANKYFKSP